MRRILIEPEQNQLEELSRRFRDRQLRTDDVSEVLAEAISKRSEQDHSLSEALAAPVEAVLRTSVRKNPEVLIDALFPIMGPAIRKAISDALGKMVQTLNASVEHSLSIQGLKWRLEAWRSGRPFGEVVLLHTLQFRIEQVFLIHRESGLLIQHVAAESSLTESPDLVSAMLTAIREFARDSFSVAKSVGLDELQLGDLVIWVEQGPEALLAAAIRGNPPSSFRNHLKKTIEKIHGEWGEELERFDGQTDRFEAVQPLLKDSLQEEAKEKKGIVPGWILAAVLVGVILLWGTYSLYDSTLQNRRWSDYIELLNGEPGIVVTMEGRRGDQFQVSGLRDPLAVEPTSLLEQVGLSQETVTEVWEPYLAFHPDFVLERARVALAPPDSVVVGFRDGVLSIGGTASKEWISRAKQFALLIPGISHLDAGGLKTRELAEFEALRKKVESQNIFFELGSSRIGQIELGQLTDLAADLRTLLEAGQAEQIDVWIEVQGSTDAAGSETLNQRLSEERARNVRGILLAQGIEAKHIRTVGRGPDLDTKGEKSTGARSVRLRIIVED